MEENKIIPKEPAQIIKQFIEKMDQITQDRPGNTECAVITLSMTLDFSTQLQEYLQHEHQPSTHRLKTFVDMMNRIS